MSQGCEAEHLCLGFDWEGGLVLGEEIFFPRGDDGGSGSRGISALACSVASCWLQNLSMVLVAVLV